MNNPTNPSVSDARKLAEKHGLQRCIVFFAGADDRVGYASYGMTRGLCEGTRRVADAMWDTYVSELMREARR